MILAGVELKSTSPAGIFRLGLGTGWFFLTTLALTTVTPAHAGTLSGTIRHDGLRPPARTIYMGADPACDKLHPNGIPAFDFVVAESGGVANALVFVHSGLPKDYVASQPVATVAMHQTGCIYSPHVVGVRVGQELEIRNGDATIHNVNARATDNESFNIAMPAQDQTIRRTFPRPEVALKLKCDIHPWMSAYVGVFEHPFFAVTDSQGAFQITGLPEGEYTIDVWHEVLGEKRATVNLDADDPATLDFAFAGN